jgi:predicted RNA binding protein YcfA (HicA-like mRNA interferase family)
MPKLSGISHQRVIKAFERAGFRVARQGKHVTLTDGERIVTVPRSDPVNSFTLAGIIKDAGLSIEEFKKLL